MEFGRESPEFCEPNENEGQRHHGHHANVVRGVAQPVELHVRSAAGNSLFIIPNPIQSIQICFRFQSFWLHTRHFLRLHSAIVVPHADLRVFVCTDHRQMALLLGAAGHRFRPRISQSNVRSLVAGRPHQHVCKPHSLPIHSIPQIPSTKHQVHVQITRAGICVHGCGGSQKSAGPMSSAAVVSQPGLLRTTPHQFPSFHSLFAYLGHC